MHVSMVMVQFCKAYRPPLSQLWSGLRTFVGIVGTVQSKVDRDVESGSRLVVRQNQVPHNNALHIT